MKNQPEYNMSHIESTKNESFSSDKLESYFLLTLPLQMTISTEFYEPVLIINLKVELEEKL